MIIATQAQLQPDTVQLDKALFVPDRVVSESFGRGINDAPPRVVGITPAGAVASSSLASTTTASSSASGGSGPSIGYGYTPPAVQRSVSPSRDLATQEAQAPTTLPTVTTWASSVSSHWVLVAAVGLALVLLILYRRGK